MGYPVFPPPVHHSVVFHMEGGQKAPHQRHVVALTTPRQYGLSVRDYDLAHVDHSWPSMSEYQAIYGKGSKAKRSEPHSACRRCPVPFPGPEDFTVPPINSTCQGRPGPSSFQLLEKAPTPLLAKRLAGCHYHVTQPLGMVTDEEKSKCRLGLLGPEKMTWRTEYDHAFTPNYHYKAWIDRPMPQLAQEMESNILMCRAPALDMKHYDLYHQVRMHRPTPIDAENKFLSCAVVPIP